MAVESTTSAVAAAKKWACDPVRTGVTTSK
jgi:hypothetical protein